MTLDNEQKRAVETNEKKVLVAAAAGSGKTRCITERLKYLLNQGYNPKNIYAITYTNNAAQEMKNRIGNTDVFIGTIHGLANYILLTNGYDTSKYIKEEAFYKLLELTKEDNVVLPQADFLLIDEFQDVRDDEYEFCLKTLNPNSLFVVGDSRQAIFSFQGSNSQHFLDLVRDPEVAVYELNSCYRCGEEIIEFAECFLIGMHDIYNTDIISKADSRGKVTFLSYDIDDMVSIIRDSWDSYRKWFIICRTNAEVDEILSMLQIHKIPCDTFKKADLTLEELIQKQEEDTVKVLTIHSAKGMECENVMVIGAHKFNNEERRISYVAATRAKSHLFRVGAPKKRKIKRKSSETGRTLNL